MLKTLNLCKDYKIKNGTVKALDDINVEFPNIGLYSIIGKSGSGKTTLLNCLAGIDKVTSGSIFYDNIDITKLKNKQLDYYREEVSFIFQDYNLLSDYSVSGNIGLSIKIQGMSNQETQKIVFDALDKVGLKGYENRKITELSGGEQQRVVIARALAKNSKVIFCDEPTGNLDDSTARDLFQILKELSKNRLVIVVTHNNTLAKDFSDGIVELDKGKIILNSIQNSNKNNEKTENIKNKRKINFSFYSKLCLEQIKALKVFSLFILILFIASFTTFTIFDSISNFDTTEALINTLKNNNQTVLGLETYRDFVEEKVTKSGIEYDYGVSVYYIEDTIEETKKLKEKIQGKASIYNSYLYIKSFNSLFDIDYPFELEDTGEDFVFHYHSFYFNQLIAVDDFDNFSMPLLYGKYPSRNNEILIYDYMADNMLYHKVYTGKIKDIVGKKIKDDVQGLEFIISGIIKSNYKDYEYTDGMATFASNRGLIYLNSLKSIYAKKEIIDKIKIDHMSIDGTTLVQRNEENDIRIRLESFNGIQYVHEDHECIKKGQAGWGLMLTLSQVKTILGLDRMPTDNELDDFVSKMDSENKEWYIKYWNYSDINYDAFYVGNLDAFYGIVEDSEFDDNTILHTGGGYSITDGNVSEVVYLSLNKDYSNAKEVLSMFKYPNHDEKYYEDCIKNRNFYHTVGFCVYDTSQILIDEASEYLYKISDIAKVATIICYCLIVFGIIDFCLLSIKKQTYKIGILKSLGAKNSQIGASFVISITFIAMVAYLISIPCSFIGMSLINKDFVNTIEDINLIMYSINPIGLVIPLLITLGITLLTSVVIYISFTINPPVFLIRQNKER